MSELGLFHELRHVFDADGPVLREGALRMDQALVALGTVCLLLLPMMFYKEIRDKMNEAEDDDDDDDEKKKEE